MNQNLGAVQGTILDRSENVLAEEIENKLLTHYVFVVIKSGWR